MRDDRVDGNRFREGRRNQEHLGIPYILIQTIWRSSGVAGYGKEIELIDDDLTYRVIGCAMKVHNTLGSGFQEVIYQRALAIEMERAKIDFGREVEQSIYCDGVEIGTRRADFIIEDRVVVELKALVALDDVHLAQAKNYAVAYNFDIGLLINFGASRLEYKRVFNDRKN